MPANPPTLINLPPPPSEVATPSDMPGTPNSTTTSMSELSTVAIKDGHRGHFPHHHHPAEAERADRISRLAGLERIGVAGRNPPGLAAGAGGSSNLTPAYFDAHNQPQIVRERSTVGSASATGSVGGRTTWASGSDMYDPDRMSEDQDVETSSMGGFSDEAASLVGFGEGARTPARQNSHLGSPAVSKGASTVPPHLREQQQASGSPLGASSGTTQASSATEQQKLDPKVIDGMTYDEGFVDTSDRTPPLTGHDSPTQDLGGAQTSEEVIRQRLLQRQRAAEAQAQAQEPTQDTMEMERQT